MGIVSQGHIKRLEHTTFPGICHSFNSKQFGEIWTESKFTETFSNVYREEMENGFDRVQSSSDMDTLTLILDKQTYLGPDRLTSPKGQWGIFRIGVNDIYSPFSMNLGKFKL